MCFLDDELKVKCFRKIWKYIDLYNISKYNLICGNLGFE